MRSCISSNDPNDVWSRLLQLLATLHHSCLNITNKIFLIIKKTLDASLRVAYGITNTKMPRTVARASFSTSCQTFTVSSLSRWTDMSGLVGNSRRDAPKSVCFEFVTMCWTSILMLFLPSFLQAASALGFVRVWDTKKYAPMHGKCSIARGTPLLWKAEGGGCQISD